MLEISILSTVLELNSTVIREVQQWNRGYTWPTQDLITFTLAIILVTVAGIFVIFLVGTAAVNVLRGRDPVTLYFNHPDAIVRTSARNYVSLSVARRPTAERDALVDHCAKYVFRNSVFRKHRYARSLSVNHYGRLTSNYLVSSRRYGLYSGALSQYTLTRSLLDMRHTWQSQLIILTGPTRGPSSTH